VCPPVARFGLRPGSSALPQTVESTERQPESDSLKATILVGDDDPSLRELIRAVLGPGYRFVEAADGREVLTVARDVRPDLIVLDVMLPGLSGIEVLDILRADEELRETPVVVITAWSHAEVDAWTAGADRFVSKPFDPDELSNAVEELLA
jgi:CheY-like chemotaxis protein